MNHDNNLSEQPDECDIHCTPCTGPSQGDRAYNHRDRHALALKETTLFFSLPQHYVQYLQVVLEQMR